MAGLSPQAYTAVTSYVKVPGAVRINSAPGVKVPVVVVARSVLVAGAVNRYHLKLVAPGAVAVNTGAGLLTHIVTGLVATGDAEKLITTSSVLGVQEPLVITQRNV